MDSVRLVIPGCTRAPSRSSARVSRRIDAVAIRALCTAALALIVSGIAEAAEPAASPRPSLAGSLLPVERLVAWNPGLMSAGGIPSRTIIYRTLSPSGRDDGGAIQAALSAAPVGQVVMLGPGTFIVNEPLLISRPVTLRGAGAGATRLVKTNGARARTSAVIAGTKGILTPVDPSSYSYDPKPVIIVGPSRWNNGPDSSASQNLLADGDQGTSTVTLASTANLKRGDFVLLDEISGASWQATPSGFPAGAKVWQGDRVAWNMHYPVQPGDDNAGANAGAPMTRPPVYCRSRCRGSPAPKGRPQRSRRSPR
ncbi:hypothetical protein ACRAVF_31870 [Bradyrhizobium oligotrophicum S58]